MGGQQLKLAMDDSVDTLCEQLKLTKLKKEEIVVELNEVKEVVNRGKNCLLVKLLTRKYFNKQAFKSTMKKLWRPTKSLHFSKMGAGLMIAEFEDLNDKHRVIKDGP